MTVRITITLYTRRCQQPLKSLTTLRFSSKLCSVYVSDKYQWNNFFIGKARVKRLISLDFHSVFVLKFTLRFSVCMQFLSKFFSFLFHLINIHLKIDSCKQRLDTYHLISVNTYVWFMRYRCTWCSLFYTVYLYRRPPLRLTASRSSSSASEVLFFKWNASIQTSFPIHNIYVTLKRIDYIFLLSI